MTAAICIKCGAMKLGAFTLCPKCGFTPESTQDKDRAIFLSDHNMRHAALKRAGKSIAAGTAPAFDEEAISRMTAGSGGSQTVSPTVAKLYFIVWLSVMALAAVALIAVGLYFLQAAWRR